MKPPELMRADRPFLRNPIQFLDRHGNQIMLLEIGGEVDCIWIKRNDFIRTGKRVRFLKNQESVPGWKSLIDFVDIFKKYRILLARRQLKDHDRSIRDKTLSESAEGRLLESL